MTEAFIETLELQTFLNKKDEQPSERFYTLAGG